MRTVFETPRGEDVYSFLDNFNFIDLVKETLKKYKYTELEEVRYNGLAIFLKYNLGNKPKTIIISICKNMDNEWVWFVDRLPHYQEFLKVLNENIPLADFK